MHIFLTGASADLGDALARELARAGHPLSPITRPSGRFHAQASTLTMPCHVARCRPAQAALGPIIKAGQQVIGHGDEVPFPDTRRVAGKPR